MRAYENQLAANKPIRRTPAEKTKQLAQLRLQLDMLPARAQDATRQAIKSKIAELEQELRATTPPTRTR